MDVAGLNIAAARADVFWLRLCSVYVLSASVMSDPVASRLLPN